MPRAAIARSPSGSRRSSREFEKIALPRLARWARGRHGFERGDERFVETGAHAGVAIEPGAAGARGAERVGDIREVRGPRILVGGEPAQPDPAEADVADLVGVDLI